MSGASKGLLELMVIEPPIDDRQRQLDKSRTKINKEDRREVGVRRTVEMPRKFPERGKGGREIPFYEKGTLELHVNEIYWPTTYSN